MNEFNIKHPSHWEGLVRLLSNILPIGKAWLGFGGLLLVFLFSLVSCNDDDTFTTSQQNRLYIPEDTLKMDTIFAKIPAPSKDFWIYNNSGDGIRCANVRLQKGNQSGFRVNVDGI